jgi:hypothetical protein
MNINIELNKPDLQKKVIVKSHAYDLVEFTVKQVSFDKDGKELTNSYHTTFYNTKEFKDFFQPLVNELKVRFDNDIPNSTQE